MYEYLKRNPFCLEEKQIRRVADTIKGMTLEEKVGQLFCQIAYTSDLPYLEALVHRYHVGGVMGRRMPEEEAWRTFTYLRQESKIPLLLSANFEAGSDGLLEEGTNVGNNLQVAATGDVAFAKAQAQVAAREGGAYGANWSFAPIVDIDRNFRNPITGTRVYGSDVEMVRKCGKIYIETMQSMGVAACAKHFPGDGCDERDQHLLPSVNDLSCEEWMETYGKVYQDCIEAGVLTIMAGQILQPAWSKRLKPELKDEDILPASLSEELLNGLLRQMLGFNGLIVTDATTMAGFEMLMDRSRAVPGAIAAGCDMFLFTRNLEEDYQFMMQGVKDGIISEKRLEEALVRVLGLKESLGLFERQGKLEYTYEEAKAMLGSKEHKELEEACAERSVTLVKNKEGILPFSPLTHKRILLYPIEKKGKEGKVEELLLSALEAEGFAVDVFRSGNRVEGQMGGWKDVADCYDLLLYVANLETASDQTTVRIDWMEPRAANCPVYLSVVPTVFISFANPYHLLDAPRIKTFINAYKLKPAVVKAVMNKLLGRSSFCGISPVDPFCGKWDTYL